MFDDFISFNDIMSSREVEKLADIQARHPFNCIISGPSQSGKTTHLRDFLENHKLTIHNLDKDIINVAWFYGKWQKYYEKPLKDVSLTYIEGLPDEEQVKGFDIIVIDDLMHEINKSSYVKQLFTAGTHHDNQSVIVVAQSFYQISITLRQNSHLVILFKDPADISHVQTMSWRMFPDRPKYLLSAYMLATSQPHGYLVIDRTQGTPDNCRLRTNTIPNQNTGFQLRPIGFDPT